MTRAGVMPFPRAVARGSERLLSSRHGGRREEVRSKTRGSGPLHGGRLPPPGTPAHLAGNSSGGGRPPLPPPPAGAAGGGGKETRARRGGKDPPLLASLSPLPPFCS